MTTQFFGTAPDSGLVQFLLARIAEDEAGARAVTERQPIDQWDAVGAAGEDDAALSYWGVARIAHAEPNPAARSIAQHIARWDPARVLAECEAKRRIVERAQFVSDHGPARDHLRAMDMTTGASAVLGDVLRWLAMPYAAHSEYRTEWAAGE
ncbi:MAG: DUF6221 family protein [Pseudonocardiaceae bacterium]